MRFCCVDLKKIRYMRFFLSKTAMSSFFFIPLSCDSCKNKNLDKSSMGIAQESNEENDTINVALRSPNENEIH